MLREQSPAIRCDFAASQLRPFELRNLKANLELLDTAAVTGELSAV